MLKLVITPGIWLLIIIVAVLLDYLVKDYYFFFHPIKLMFRLIALLRNIFNRGKDLRVKGFIFWISVMFSITFFLVILYFLIAYFNVYFRIVFYSILLSTLISENYLNRLSIDIEETIREKNFEKTLQLLRGLGLREDNKLRRRDTIQFTIEALAEAGVDQMIGPIFFMSLGTLTSIVIPFFNPVLWGFLYKAITIIPILIPNSKPEYKEFSYYPYKLYTVANNIPNFLTAYLIILSGLILGLYTKNVRKIYKKERTLFPNLSYRAPLAALAGLLGIQIGGITVYDGEKINNIYIGNAIYPIRAEDISDTMNILLCSEFIFILIIIAIAVLLYWVI